MVLSQLVGNVRDVKLPKLTNASTAFAEVAAVHGARFEKTPECFHPTIRGLLERAVGMSAAEYIRNRRVCSQLTKGHCVGEELVQITRRSCRTPTRPTRSAVSRFCGTALFRGRAGEQGAWTAGILLRDCDEQGVRSVFSSFGPPRDSLHPGRNGCRSPIALKRTEARRSFAKPLRVPSVT
jgi:hypothetical protein